MYYNGFVFVFVWCPCMAIDASVQHNGGFLPGIILLTQCYYHNRGTRLNAMKSFLFLQPMIPPKRFDIFSPLRAVLMGTNSRTKILILPKIFPTRFRLTFYG